MKTKNSEEKEFRTVDSIVPAALMSDMDTNIQKAQRDYENRIQTAVSSLKDFVITH